MKKTKKIAIIFAILVIISSVVFGAVYYFTDTFKTPKQAFYQYLGKAAKIDNRYTYQELLDEIKTSETKSYKSETSIGLELNGMPAGYGYNARETQEMLNLLKNIKLKINTEAKPSEKKSVNKISLNYGGLSMGNVQLVRDNDTYGIKSDLLDNKYLAIENNNLKDLMKKLGKDASQIPNKIESLDVYDLLYVSKEDQEKIENNYKDIFKDTIPEERYTKQENVTQKVNGEDVNTKEYKLSLEETDVINVMEKILQKVYEDDTLLDIVVEKINKLVESSAFDNLNAYTTSSVSSIAKSRSSQMLKNISKSDIKSAISELLKAFKQEQNYASNSKAEISVYVANNDVAKIEFKAAGETLASIEFFKKDDKNHIVIYAQANSFIGTDYYMYNSYRRTSGLQKMMEIEYKNSSIGEKKTSEGSFTFFQGDEKIGKIGYDITSNGKFGEGRNESSGKISIEADKMSMAFVIDSVVEFTDNVSVESLNDRNANILNNMSKQEIENYFSNLTKTLENTLAIFGVNNRVNLPNSKSEENKTEKDYKEEENELTERVKELEEEVKDKVKDAQEEVKEKVNEAQQEVKEKASEAQEIIKKDTEAVKKEIEDLQKQLNERLKQLEQGNS